MHDPKTVAFDIRRPWKDRPTKIWPNGYRPTWITIWHVDPETDGTDNSCGWAYVKLSPEERERARKLGREEFDFMLGKHGWKMSSFELLYNTWSAIAWRFDRRRMTPEEALRVMSLSMNPIDNFRFSIEVHPTNGTAPFKGITTPEELGDLFASVLRCYRTYHRRWWQHPRWHFWHWEIQFTAAQPWLRYLFGERCASCDAAFHPAEGSPVNIGDGKLRHWKCART